MSYNWQNPARLNWEAIFIAKTQRIGAVKPAD